MPRNMQGQPDALRIWAIEVALSSEEGKKLYDPILDGLRSAVRYDRTYFDKIVASLLPLLEKLTTGKTAELLSPDYQDIDDTRPILTGNRSSVKKPWCMWGSMRSVTVKWRARSVTPCSPIW